MLPVVICAPDSEMRAQWLDILEELVRGEYPSLRLEILSGSEREFDRTLGAQAGILLALLCVSESAQDGVEGCIRLFQRAMARNRDNYVLLLLDDAGQLDAVLSHCMRPAGVLLLPLRRELMCASLRRVFNDYLSLHSDAGDTEYLIVTAGKTVQRIAYQDILYLEAQNKMLNICMRHHALTVRASLNELEKSLPPDFLRCHRSYIVNRRYVERFDSPQMMLELSTQERIPVSRSCKDALREGLREGGWI